MIVPLLRAAACRRRPTSRSAGAASLPPWLPCLLAALPSPLFAQLPGAVEDAIDKAMPELLESYRHLHAHPELSFREAETAALLARRLAALGFTVTERIGDYRGAPAGATSFGLVGILENGNGATLMLRTDLDALPVREETGVDYASNVRAPGDDGEEVPVMHACGHDVHMTVWLGAARVLAEHRDRWRGTLLMLAQPAEERGAGARAMLDGGLYERFPVPDAAVALHVSALLPAGTVGLRSGYALANVDSVDVTVRGKGGHGGYPHQTVDPVVIAAQIVLGLQTIVSRQVSPLESAVITVGSIHGGTKHNVIPDDVALQITVRSYEPDVRRTLLDGIHRVARGTALAAGVAEDRLPVVTVRDDEFTPALFNDPDLTTRLRASFTASLGASSVVEAPAVMGGEDFSRYAREDRSVPICMYWLGVVDPAELGRAHAEGAPPSLHSSRFCPLPEPSIRTGVRAMTTAALALLPH